MEDLLLIGYDKSSQGDMTTLSVAKHIEKHKIKFLNFFMGEEAEWMYRRLLQPKEYKIL